MTLSGCLSLSVALFLLSTGHVLARLSQTTTNGNSLLGDLSAPSFAEYLTDNPLSDGFPWGEATALNTNYYTSSPDTGSVPSQAEEPHAKISKASFESTTGSFHGVVLDRMVTESRWYL